MSDGELRAIGWDHPRCMGPMRACSDEWGRMGHGRIDWDARSLQAFGDEPLEQIAGRYDLLVIDHPFCGAAARSGCLVALDQLVEARALAALAAAAVGPSQSSYRHQGQTWALAFDAACQVSALGGDQWGCPAPVDWPDAIELARSLGRRAALPLAPAHSISSLLTLWAGAGLEPLSRGILVEPQPGLEQLEWLVELHRLGHPAATGWQPPQALDALSAEELAYVPLTYGYVSYSMPSAPGSACRFANIPGISGAVLGGAGLAVSSACAHPHEAAAFAAWACGPDAQRRIVAPNGGQPASAGCWEDPSLDAASGRFYSGTGATMQAAWVRPCEPWWPRFQLHSGRALTTALEQGEPAPRILERLLAIHDQTAQERGLP